LEATVLTKPFAEQFAAQWISAWNARDLELVLSHYADDFVMSSPLIATIAQEPSGTLRGKHAVGAYWKQALALTPALHFELVSTLIGADSVTIYYKGARSMAAEVFFFKSQGQVSKACAHYA
jgi:hypothetical protein